MSQESQESQEFNVVEVDRSISQSNDMVRIYQSPTINHPKSVRRSTSFHNGLNVCNHGVGRCRFLFEDVVSLSVAISFQLEPGVAKSGEVWLDPREVIVHRDLGSGLGLSIVGGKVERNTSKPSVQVLFQ